MGIRSSILKYINGTVHELQNISGTVEEELAGVSFIQSMCDSNDIMVNNGVELLDITLKLKSNFLAKKGSVSECDKKTMSPYLETINVLCDSIYIINEYDVKYDKSGDILKPSPIKNATPSEMENALIGFIKLPIMLYKINGSCSTLDLSSHIILERKLISLLSHLLNKEERNTNDLDFIKSVMFLMKNSRLKMNPNPQIRLKSLLIELSETDGIKVTDLSIHNLKTVMDYNSGITSYISEKYNKRVTSTSAADGN